MDFSFNKEYDCGKKQNTDAHGKHKFHFQLLAFVSYRHGVPRFHHGK